MRISTASWRRLRTASCCRRRSAAATSRISARKSRCARPSSDWRRGDAHHRHRDGKRARRLRPRHLRRCEPRASSGVTWGGEDLRPISAPRPTARDDGAYTEPYRLARITHAPRRRRGRGGRIDSVYHEFPRPRGLVGRVPRGSPRRLRRQDGDPPRPGAGRSTRLSRRRAEALAAPAPVVDAFAANPARRGVSSAIDGEDARTCPSSQAEPEVHEARRTTAATPSSATVAFRNPARLRRSGATLRGDASPTVRPRHREFVSGVETK